MTAVGASTTHLAGTRATYTVTPQMFSSALVQYNTGARSVSANVRFRWEYRPGSELFVVYNEQRDTGAVSFPELQNRALIVKVNRLVERFWRGSRLAWGSRLRAPGLQATGLHRSSSRQQ